MKKLNKKCDENWYNIFLFNLLFYLTIFGWLWEKNSFWDDIVFLAVQFGKMIQIKELRFCHKLKLPNLYISISLQSDYVNLGYFKLRLFGPTEFLVWNIKGRKKKLARKNIEIRNLEKWSLGQKLSSFRLGYSGEPPDFFV